MGFGTRGKRRLEGGVRESIFGRRGGSGDDLLLKENRQDFNWK